MTPVQQELIRSSWRTLEPMADEVTTRFYARLFELDPDLRALFAYTDMDRQRAQVMAMLAVVVRYIDRLDHILPEVDALGRRHAAYGVAVEHFAPVGLALLSAFESSLGDACTDATLHAWAAAYRRMSSTMIAASQQAAAHTPRPRRRRASAALPLGWQLESTPT